MLSRGRALQRRYGRSSKGSLNTMRASFVSKVHAATRDPRVLKFGDSKSYVASLWDLLQHDPEIARYGERGFKRALSEASTRGDIAMSRADLISAHDPKLLARSEISDPAMPFAGMHFVVHPKGTS